MVQMFGLNEQGETASIYVEGYTPFFYIKVGDDWDNKTVEKFKKELKYPCEFFPYNEAPNELC